MRQRRQRCPFELELMPHAVKCIICALCGLGRNFDVDFVQIMLMQQVNEWIFIRHNCECGRHRRCTNAIGSDAVHKEGGWKV